MTVRATIGAGLLCCALGLDAGPAEADRSTIVGNGGTITLDWHASSDKAGRPMIEGHVTTYGAKSGYCRPVLLVETLDAQGAVTASHVGFIPGYVGGFDDVYFQEPVRAPGAGYRVSISSWEKCAGGGGP
jgi:hypothetical protein